MYAFHKYFLNSYHVAGVVVGQDDTMMNKTDTVSGLTELSI